MEPIKEIVKDPHWQKIRKTLLGKWKENPEWCISQLRKYLGGVTTANEKKLRIIMNYLTGTAFRLGKISHPSINKLRAEISAELKKRKFNKKKD